MRLTRASGVLLHPTSLPGPHGSGDLGPAARHFVDWLASGGQRLWQVLPLGGIGAGNSPYMSSSAFAGNPLLIDLQALHDLGWLQAQDLQTPAGFSAQRIDYDRVVPWRMQRLRQAARAFFAECDAPNDGQMRAYRAFTQAQASWLDDYALFMALVTEQDGRDWRAWPRPLALREPAALRDARHRLAGEIAFWTFCQWCFDRQWRELRAYAHSREVKIVGDAPIFVSAQSADVWAHQPLFELDADGQAPVVAGVPPDYFSQTGQRWGNPLYRWSAHAQDSYAWWLRRLRALFDWVDIVRIDHFRGFEACWEIPAAQATAVNGRWVPGPGAALFEALDKAMGTLPIIAEDLGIITPEVAALRRRFALPGMRILQFAWGGSSGNPYLPHNHETDSVVYSGTHDNDTSQGWWAGLDERTRDQVRRYLSCDGSQIHWDLIRAACASVADTAIHPMQDVLGLGSEHRMNTPGQSQGCWAWRFEWSQVTPEHAGRLLDLTRMYRRDGTPLDP